MTTKRKENAMMRYFFVFQNKTFHKEQAGGYLWAPDGKCSHWQLMREVSRGDIIFHSYRRNIVAISKAKSDCYPAIQPQELLSERLWDEKGLRVDCEYFLLPSVLDTKIIMEQLLELQPAKYAPFNICGRGNTGYLFDCSTKMATFIFERLKRLDENAPVIETI